MPYEVELLEPAAEFLERIGGKLRAKQGSDIVRLFYFSAGERIYVVTSGYVKKENKIDRREIERAMRLRATILERRDEDH